MASTAVQQGTGHQWAGVVAIAAGTFVMVTSEFLPIGLLGTIAQDLDVSEGRAGLMVTAPGFVAAIAAPLLTIVAGRIDRRLMLAGLTALILLADLLVAVAPGLTAVLAGRMLLGAALGGFWAFSAAAGRRLVAGVDGNRATAVILGGISVGTVAGVPIGTLLGDIVGWRAAFLTIGGLAALVLAAQLVLLPALPGAPERGARQIFMVAQNPAVRIGFAAAALVAGGHFAAYTYLQPFLSAAARINNTTLTVLLAGFGVAGIAGTWAGARLASADVLRTFAGVAFVMAAAIGTALLAGPEPRLVVPAVMLWGAGFGALPVCVQIWTHQAAPEQFEGGSALMVTVFQLAVAIGAFAGGVAVDARGPAAAFLLGSIVVLLAAPILLTARKHSRAPE